MKKRILAIALIFAFVFTSTAGVYAKGARSFGGGRSFSGGRSYSKSFSYKGSSKSFSSGSSKSGGVFGSSKSGSSSKSSGSSVFGSSKSSSSSKSSTARSIPGSNAYKGSSSKKTTTSGFASKTSSKKNSYMKDAYKSQVSSKNYNTYKQKLNADQQKVYNESMKRDFSMGSKRMNFDNAMNTRGSRINSFGKRPIFINVNTGMFANPFSYGYAYVGPWDLWFLMRASDMFWFHHWHEISPYRNYFDQQKYNELERRVQELEQQGVQRDPNYLDPDVDPDLQLSQQYQEENVDKVYYTDKHPTSSSGKTATAVVFIIITSVVLIIVIRKVSRPKPKRPHRSSIY